MTRRLSQSACLLALTFSLAACSKAEKRAHDDSETGETLATAPALEDVEEPEVHELTPSELPLTSDFAKAAAKRVTPDNYRKELVRIEKELAQLQRESPMSH